MTNIKEEHQENSFEFMQDFRSFTFGIGYSYTKSEHKANLIQIEFMFWSLDFAWDCKLNKS